MQPRTLAFIVIRWQQGGDRQLGPGGQPAVCGRTCDSCVLRFYFCAAMLMECAVTDGDCHILGCEGSQGQLRCSVSCPTLGIAWVLQGMAVAGGTQVPAALASSWQLWSVRQEEAVFCLPLIPGCLALCSSIL